MPRTARSIVGGCCYHLINRGNNCARIFHSSTDYFAFISLIRECQERREVPILAWCLMPNHLHLVVKPAGDMDLSHWTRWLFTTHVRRYHAKRKTGGRIWQGRFKAFIIQEDHHLLTVLRYVERNALRANLVVRAEQWRWGSLHWRSKSNPTLALATSPAPLPAAWTEYVNAPQTPAELQAIRACVNRQRPFGSSSWVQRKARELGLTHSLGTVGRPRKA